MEEKVKLRPPIWFGAIFWKDVFEKAFFIPPLGDLLDKNITLEDYGEGLKRIWFVPIADRPTSTMHEEGMEFKPRKKELYISAKLDYESVVNASKEGVQKMVVTAFLEMIDRYEEVGVKNFDIERFKKDVEEVFN